MIADPPFNIGQKYNGYDDELTAEEYTAFTIEWIICHWNKLKPGAALVLHGSIAASREILRACFQTKLDQFIENEICWAYNFGQCTFNKFVDAHCRAIVLRKPGNNRKWYVESVMTPSKRLLMGDKRVETSKYKGYVPFGTVWGIKTEDVMPLEPIEGSPNWGRVQGNNKERREGHPNQLPENYAERFFLAYTEPGDLCFCGFGGSGTEIAVAKKLGRSCIATDVSEFNCKSIEQRLSEINSKGL